jgi:hypothetical protein
MQREKETEWLWMRIVFFIKNASVHGEQKRNAEPGLQSA